MNLFSDTDVNEAWKIAQQSDELLGLKKRDFINGFTDGWKKAKGGSTSILIRLGGKAFSRFAEAPIANSPRDFGEALGALIGALEFVSYHPLTSSGATESYIDLINKIKSYKREFYLLVQPKLEEWFKKMERAISKNQISQEHAANYNIFKSKVTP